MARAAGLVVRRTVIGGSGRGGGGGGQTLHNEVLAREAGRRAVVGFIREMSATSEEDDEGS